MGRRTLAEGGAGREWAATAGGTSAKSVGSRFGFRYGTTESAQLLADPAVHADAGRARTLGRRYAELNQVVGAYRAWDAISRDREAFTRWLRTIEEAA